MLVLDRLRFNRGGFLLEAGIEIESGEHIAVIGPSGGGKSTLLALIAGFEQADQGRILWNGADLSAKPPAERPISMLFQDNNLFPHLDILTNAALGMDPSARTGPEARRAAHAALGEVGLADLASRRPAGLSGGQLSRAALARVLISNRPLVLLDEPFAALGPAQRAEMLELLSRLLHAATILMVTHNPEDAQRFAGRTIFLAEGRLRPPCRTPELFADPDPQLADYLRR
ncbi:MAG: ATP-binding cassette domain-containing protein [Rhodobacteraceae bacterium]|nr:ATP-binding cassette domain-containing protein [Paracoccaceae bacterium]